LHRVQFLEIGGNFSAQMLSNGIDIRKPEELAQLQLAGDDDEDEDGEGDEDEDDEDAEDDDACDEDHDHSVCANGTAVLSEA